MGDPNENFKTQLREYQPIYQARLSGSHGTVGGEGVAGATHAKRRQHEEDDLLADHYADHDHDPDFGGDGGMRDADMATVE
ncbi:hypothetical protein HDU83_009151 [Entophlyctis luteolus]|nr:hypothetical protein HDU83_009151 [Entophlyctis luteolus]